MKKCMWIGLCVLVVVLGACGRREQMQGEVSDATQGNAAADAARTYLLFSLAGDKETADLYLRTFCEKSDTAMQYVQKWLPIVAASQSVKGNPEERQFLLGWVNVVDFE